MSIMSFIKRVAYRCVVTVCPHFHIHRLFRYDKNRYLAHSGSLHQDCRGQNEARLMMAYHVLEKGLTMPERRLGFGHDAVLNLVCLLEGYRRSHGDKTSCFEHGIAVLKAYAGIHEQEGYALDPEVETALDRLLKDYPEIPADYQIKITKEQYFAHKNDAFPLFSMSRHSVRHLCGHVPEARIKEAVELAMNAPSACNRQHTRVHCISDKEKMKRVLSLQNGSRGFGFRGDKLLVISSSLHCLRWAEERNDLYTNAGIFVMNLCYALHYCGIAHCILNCSVPPKYDRCLRGIINLPDEESLVCYILCGDCPDEFMIASSPRKKVEETLTFH